MSSTSSLSKAKVTKTFPALVSNTLLHNPGPVGASGETRGQTLLAVHSVSGLWIVWSYVGALAPFL